MCLELWSKKASYKLFFKDTLSSNIDSDGSMFGQFCTVWYPKSIFKLRIYLRIIRIIIIHVFMKHCRKLWILRSWGAASEGLKSTLYEYSSSHTSRYLSLIAISDVRPCYHLCILHLGFKHIIMYDVRCCILHLIFKHIMP